MQFYKDAALDGAGCHVIFSGQNFYEAQIPNCETKNTPRPAQETGFGSGEIEIGTGPFHQQKG